MRGVVSSFPAAIRSRGYIIDTPGIKGFGTFDMEQLRPVVKGHHRHHRIGPGALPGQTEGVLAARHLQHHIRPSVGAVGQDRLPEPLRLQCQHLRIVGTDESQALGVPLTDDDPPGVFQQDALESAQAGGAGAQDEHRVLR